MKIVAIGCFPLDLELACFGTLSRCVRDGHEVHLIVAKDEAVGWTHMKVDALRKASEKIGISQVQFTERFDYSAIIQDNVSLLGSFLRSIDPSLVIMPFWKANNKKRKILAKTSLIASRGIGKVIMYELERNSSFVPTLYFAVSSEDSSTKMSCIESYCKLIAEPLLDRIANSFTLDLVTMKKYPSPPLLQVSLRQKSKISIEDTVTSHCQHDQQLQLVDGLNTGVEKSSYSKNSHEKDTALQGHIKQQSPITDNYHLGQTQILVEVFESHRILLVDNDGLF